MPEVEVALPGGHQYQTDQYMCIIHECFPLTPPPPPPPPKKKKLNKKIFFFFFKKKKIKKKKFI
jgi:hypothetical protein